MSGRDPRAGIDAKCLDCMHWQRGRIAACPIVCCPLWPYRPFARAEAPEAPAPAKKRKKPQRRAKRRKPAKKGRRKA